MHDSDTAIADLRAAWDDYSRLRRSSCRTAHPATSCMAWRRVEDALSIVERQVTQVIGGWMPDRR